MALKVEKNLAGEFFFIGFLTKLDNSKSLGKSFFWPFWPFGEKSQKLAKKNIARRIDR